MASDDEELWAPFLAFRPEDRHAARLRRHVEQDMKRGARHVPRRAAALSRDEIVRTAIKVADAEGPDAFSMRRKQMRRVVRSIGSLDAERAEESLARAAIDPAARPETLSPLDFSRLRRELFSRGS